MRDVSPEFWVRRATYWPRLAPMRWRLKRARCRGPAFDHRVHGGDGTLHWTVTALLRATASVPAPLALLPGGTMNVVASSLGILVQTRNAAGAVAAAQRDVRPHSVVLRRCMKFRTNTASFSEPASSATSSRNTTPRATTGRPARSGSCCAPSCLKLHRALRQTHLSSLPRRVFVDGRSFPGQRCSGWRRHGQRGRPRLQAQPPRRRSSRPLQCPRDSFITAGLDRDLSAVRWGRGISPAAPGARWPRAWSSSRRPKPYTPWTAISTERAQPVGGAGTRSFVIRPRSG